MYLNVFCKRFIFFLCYVKVKVMYEAIEYKINTFDLYLIILDKKSSENTFRISRLQRSNQAGCSRQAGSGTGTSAVIIAGDQKGSRGERIPRLQEFV